jgi:hypothetical protein
VRRTWFTRSVSVVNLHKVLNAKKLVKWNVYLQIVKTVEPLNAAQLKEKSLQRKMSIPRKNRSWKRIFVRVKE